MPGLPSHLSRCRQGLPVSLTLCCVLMASCTSKNDAPPGSAVAYPRAPHPAQVIRLGNLRGRVGATAEQRKLSLFLFGAEPEPIVDVIKPAGMAVDADHVIVCDSGFASVMTLSRLDASIRPARLQGDVHKPVSVGLTPDGACLIADRGQHAVLRFAAGGRMVQRYTLPQNGLHPADAVEVGEEVWVSNSAQHTIDVFAESGQYKRSLGGRGGGAGQFGMPLGMDFDGDNRVYIVDMLNNRVQVFDRTGRHLGQIGQAGNLVGSFGRPRDVAVGPDGTVFVVDAASQRVHAFDPDGRPLLAFGGPIDGHADLAVPRGVATVDDLGIPLPAVPEGFDVAYYVLISEQLNDPGIRVYAWRERARRTELAATGIDSDNPHWSAEGCAACHGPTTSPTGIPARAVDTLCLSCHDGVTATAEAHPIGRLAVSGRTTVPVDWPLIDGRLGCLTCHDIKRHCEKQARQPLENSGMLRAWDPDSRIEFCSQCHEGDGWRVNPHHQIDDAGRTLASSCVFCHTTEPAPSPDGARHGAPQLLASGSGVCLTCHARHWDYFPGGHVGTQASARVRAALNREPRGIIPLDEGTVTCYTCHNPHSVGLFPADSPLGHYANTAADQRYALRANYADLCLSCHDK